MATPPTEICGYSDKLVELTTCYATAFFTSERGSGDDGLKKFHDARLVAAAAWRLFAGVLVFLSSYKYAYVAKKLV